MRIERITFMQTFPTGSYENVKLGVEIEVEDPHPSTGMSNLDAAMDAFKEAKEIVNKAFEKMNYNLSNLPPDSTSSTPTIQEESKDHVQLRIASFIADIEACTVIDKINGFGVQVGLIAYQSEAEKHPQVAEAYQNKLKQLQ